MILVLFKLQNSSLCLQSLSMKNCHFIWDFFARIKKCPSDDHEDNNIDDPDYETKVPNNKQIHTNNKQSKTNKQEEKQVLKDENDELQCYYCCQIFMRSAIEDHMR